MAKDKAQKQQVAATKSRFMSLLNEYQVVEKEFRKKVRERGERQFKIGEWDNERGCERDGTGLWCINSSSLPLVVKPDATPEEVQQVLETDNPQIFSQAVSGKGFLTFAHASSELTNPLVALSSPSAPILQSIR